MKSTAAGNALALIVLALTVLALAVPVAVSQAAAQIATTNAPRTPQHVVSDWTQHHVLYPDSNDPSAMARLRIERLKKEDPRWLQNWYLRHHEIWWRKEHRRHLTGRRRDWSVTLATIPIATAFDPLFDFSFSIGPNAGTASLDSTDAGGGAFLATEGNLVVTAGADIGAYPLHPGGPAQTTSPGGAFLIDNLLFPSVDPPIDNNGPLFIGNGLEINIWSNGPDAYEFDTWNGSGYLDDTTGAPLTLTTAPGGGQVYPALFVFDANGTPSCTADYITIGIPANPASGGQANIVGFNNLYSSQGASLPPPLCGTSGPSVMFAYASGSGQIPASVAMSLDGTQLAYVENIPGSSSYFHVLTLGTTGSNGSAPTAAVIPGAAGGNNAIDQTVLLSPDGGITNQPSTSAPFIAYSTGDANDAAYVTTYSASAGTGYLYKLTNVFNGSAPTIVWSLPINAVPSTPVYDAGSYNIFFTDSNGRIDYVYDGGTSSPSVVYGPVVAAGNTSENPAVVDSSREYVYATFNSNGTNAVVVQAPTNMFSSVSVAVGAATGVFTGPYQPEFNNAWYTQVGTPLMYVAGTGAGTLPTLYSVGFTGTVMNSAADATTAALATGTADASLPTEFYNANLGKDFLFLGVTDNCVATAEGGTAGCVMSLDITNGFPTVNASTTAIPAAGGSTGMDVDSDNPAAEASSIYYATKTGVAMVKATQSGLN